MNAVDRIAALQFWERARRWLARGGVFVVGCATVVLVSFCAGRSSGVSAERGRIADSVRKVLADSSRAIEQRLSDRAPKLVVAGQRVDTARAEYREAAKRIVPASDTSVSIDGAPPVTVVPAALVIPPLRLCANLDTLTALRDTLVAAQLADMTKDRNTWRDRALLDEAQRASRFGFKSGLAAGAVVVAIIVRAVH